MTERSAATDIGVLIPIDNNGWIMSAVPPQYVPGFEHNRGVLRRAAVCGMDVALSMIRLLGFGGPTEFRHHGFEGVILMAGLTAVPGRHRTGR